MTSTPDLEAERERLVKSLPTRAPIYLPTSKIPLAEQVRGLREVQHQYRYHLDEARDRLRLLKRRFEGRDRAFIIEKFDCVMDLKFFEL